MSESADWIADYLVENALNLSFLRGSRYWRHAIVAA
jgi:hypothetical protein